MSAACRERSAKLVRTGSEDGSKPFVKLGTNRIGNRLAEAETDGEVGNNRQNHLVVARNHRPHEDKKRAEGQC